MIKSVLVYAFVALTYLSQAQTAWKPLIAPYLKSVGYSRLQYDVFSSTTNQASLANLTTFSAGVYGDRKFLVQELSSFSAVVALPTHSGTFGVQLHQLGNGGYAQMQGGLAYARKLSKALDVGVQFNYYDMRISGYGHAAALNFEAGAILHFTEQLHGGIHLSNPASVKIGKGMEEESLPAVYSLGFGYDASEHFFIGTEIEKSEDKNVDVNTSIQYRFTDRVLARGGISSGTSLFFFGLGIKLSDFRFDVSASLHPQLGLTPGLSLIYNKSAKNE